MENFKLTDSMIAVLNDRQNEMLQNPQIVAHLKTMPKDDAKEWLFWAAAQTLIGKNN